MATVSLEEAQQCPKCGLPGEQVSDNPAPKNMRPGTRVLLMYCRNTNCTWFDTPWPIQVNPDNTIPVVDHTHDQKLFPNLLATAEEERFVAGVARQLDQETQPGGGEVGGGRRR